MAENPEDDQTKRLSPDDITVLQGRTAPAVAATVTMSPVRLPFAGSNRLPGSTRLAEFEISGVIGEGGFGIVYTAYDHSLEREVAIKEYMPSGLAARIDGTTVGVLGEDSLETFESGLRSFVNEAKLLARFDHPSLLKVYRFWEANGTAYMAMPHYKGETLKQRLKRSGPPDEVWLRAMLLQLLAALDVIHAESCFHRDIAPDNIFLVDNDRPVLLDFGAARRVISDKTHALTVILKPGFAPLEQYADVPNLKQGAWTDLYALAALVYHAITGEKPPPSISRYISDQMQPLSQRAQGRYSPGFLAAIDRALSVQPAARPQNAAEMRALLDAPSAPATPAVESSASQPAGQPAIAAADSRTVTLQQAPAVAAPPASVVPAAVEISPPANASLVAAARVASGQTLTPVPVPAIPARPGKTPSEGPSKGISPLVWVGVAAVLVVLVVGVLFGGRLLGPPLQPPALVPTLAVRQPPAQPLARATPVTVPPASRPAVPAPVPAQTLPSVAPPAPAVARASPSPPVTVAPQPRKTMLVAQPAAASEPTTADRVAGLLSAANTSLARKDYVQAEKQAKEALALDPANVAAAGIHKQAQAGLWSGVQIQ